MERTTADLTASHAGTHCPEEIARARRIEDGARSAHVARMVWVFLLWHEFAGLLREWRLRIRTRRQMLQLDARTIRDLGLSPGQLRFEAEKPFWRR